MAQGLGSNLQQTKPLEVPGAPPDGFKGFLQRPEVMAFLMQSAATMLAGGSVGEGLGQGTAAMGRYGAAKAAKGLADEQEARRRFESDREYELDYYRAHKPAGGGGGSGGGRKGASGAGKPKTAAEWSKLLFDSDTKAWTDASKADPDGAGARPDQMAYIGKGQTMASAVANGMPFDTYMGLRSSGRQDLADQYADLWSQNPEEAKKMMEDFNNPDKHLDTPQMPADPRLPEEDPLVNPGFVPGVGKDPMAPTPATPQTMTPLPMPLPIQPPAPPMGNPWLDPLGMGVVPGLGASLSGSY